MFCTHATMQRTLEHFELLSPAGRHDYMVQLATETGGYFKAPEPKNSWDSQQYELKAEGVYASGESEASVIRNWIKAAKCEAAATRELDRALAILDGICPTTCPHAIKAACDLIINAARTPQEMRRARQLLADLAAETSSDAAA